MAVLVLEAGVGALARLYEEQVGPELKMNLNRTFLENYSVRFRETAAIDQMQKEVSTGHREEFLWAISQNDLARSRSRSGKRERSPSTSIAESNACACEFPAWHGRASFFSPSRFPSLSILSPDP